jgi:hypothetical protein
MEQQTKLVINDGKYPICPRCTEPIQEDMVIFHHPGQAAKEMTLSEAWKQAESKKCFIWHKLCYRLCWDSM